MSTTVLVSESTRDRLAAAKRAYGAASIDEVLQRVLSDATPTARQLFARRRRQVKAVCDEWGLTTLVAFGSRVRDDRAPGSDLDLVTVFPSDIGLLDVARIQDQFAQAFGCPIDLGSMPPPGSRLAAHIQQEGVTLVG